MFLFGHLASVLGTNFLIERRYKIKNSKYYLAIGSMFPDMVDKPIGSIFFNNGRWYGHSLTFLFSIFAILFILERISRNMEPSGQNLREKLQFNFKNIRLFALGALAHLVGDYGIKKETVFHPFFGPFPEGSRGGFIESALEPLNLFLEGMGLTVLIVIGLKESWGRVEWKRFISLIAVYIIALFTAYMVFEIWDIL